MGSCLFACVSARTFAVLRWFSRDLFLIGKENGSWVWSNDRRSDYKKDKPWACVRRDIRKPLPTSECKIQHASWDWKEDLFESDTADSYDTEEWRSWSINAIERKSCEFEEEEEEGMELDVREAQELEKKTRFATSLDKTCARIVKHGAR